MLFSEAVAGRLEIAKGLIGPRIAVGLVTVHMVEIEVRCLG